MKHVSILVPAGDLVVGSIEGPHKVFCQANELLAGLGRPPAFRVELVGHSREATLHGGVFTLHADRTIAEVFRTDLVIVPAPSGDVRRAVAQNQEVVAWIARQYADGAEVASLCLGAFLLAATGLLNGRQCATHWLAANQFREMYPAVELVADRVITDKQGLYSSGGAYSFLNLVIYLVEKYAGRDLALLCAKVFQIDVSRSSQAPFGIFQGLKEHTDEPIRKTQEFIEAHFQQRITVAELAARCFLGRRHFERRFRKATFTSVLDYVRRVKMEVAKQRLESSRDTVADVMYAVGYADAKAFRTVFKEVTGLSPAGYRAKYQSSTGQGA